MELNLNGQLFNRNFKYLKMFEMHNKLVYHQKQTNKKHT